MSTRVNRCSPVRLSISNTLSSAVLGQNLPKKSYDLIVWPSLCSQQPCNLKTFLMSANSPLASSNKAMLRTCATL